MITQDGYKLILYPTVPRILLFDLEHDPDEMHDLSGESEQQPRISQLFARLQQLQLETGDTLDLDAVFPEL